jgi:peptide/nickel transport system permease protein
MLRLIGRRVIATIPVMLVVVTIVFVLLRVSPGDPALVLAGDAGTPEVLAKIRQELGLNQPLIVQYLSWLADVARGDLGRSIFSRRPVLDLILSRLGPTMALSASAIALTVLTAVPAGMIAAWRQDKLADRAIMAFTVSGLSVPAFVIGYLLILGFSLRMHLLPVQGYVSPLVDPIGAAEHLVLPAVTLALVYSALVTRVTRNSVLEILNEDFVRTAQAKGSSDWRLALRHVLPNAAVPIITVVGLSIASMVTGVVVTESVFNIPGVGLLTIDAILARDYPIVQGLILLFALIYVGVNLLIDIAYVAVNPRIRY